MLVQAQATAELVPARALDQAREAADLSEAWGWVERPVR
jgi:hypothetical protein